MIVLILGCGQSAQPLKSEPAEPTVAFEDNGPGGEPAIVWTELQELFPTEPAALLVPLAGLTPGMNGAAARKILEDAHQPGARIMGEAGETSVALGSILKDHPNVTVTLILDLDGTELKEVDVALPRDESVPMLTTRWGDPTSVEYGDDARATYRWSPPGAPWWAELQPVPFAAPAPGMPVTSKKALLRYLPPGAGAPAGEGQPAQPSSAPGPAPASH